MPRQPATADLGSVQDEPPERARGRDHPGGHQPHERPVRNARNGTFHQRSTTRAAHASASPRGHPWGRPSPTQPHPPRGPGKDIHPLTPRNGIGQGEPGPRGLSGGSSSTRTSPATLQTEAVGLRVCMEGTGHHRKRPRRKAEGNRPPTPLREASPMVEPMGMDGGGEQRSKDSADPGFPALGRASTGSRWKTGGRSAGFSFALAPLPGCQKEIHVSTSPICSSSPVAPCLLAAGPFGQEAPPWWRKLSGAGGGRNSAANHRYLSISSSHWSPPLPPPLEGGGGFLASPEGKGSGERPGG